MFTDDMELLQRYAATNCEQSFATLVNRHIALVFSTAQRQVGDVHAAEEITQAVFVILAQKAHRLSPKTILSGWLYQTTRLTARTHLRGEMRRQKREQEAYLQSTLNDAETNSLWQQISPVLDDAMSDLVQKDRDAVVLRFFENKSVREIAAALDVKDEAAQKRVTRAVDKLKKFFAKRGYVVPATALVGMLSANAVQAAPAGLASTVTATAIVKGTAASGSIATLINGTLKIMAWTKAKTVVVAGVGVLVAGTTAEVAVEHFSKPKDWRARFEATYGLSKSEVLKHIAPPFIPERMEFYRKDKSFAVQSRNNSQPPGEMIFEQDGRNIQNLDATWGGGETALAEAFCDLFKIQAPRLEAPEELLDLRMDGDWTVRAGASPEQLARALEKIVFNETHRKIHIAKSTVERPVIVVRGRAATVPSRLDIYVAKKDAHPGMAGGDLTEFVGALENWLHTPFVNETVDAPANKRFDWKYHNDSIIQRMADNRKEMTPEGTLRLGKVLAKIAAQTGLVFSTENRRIDVWFIFQELDDAAWTDFEALLRAPATVILRPTKFSENQWGGFMEPENGKMCGRCMTPLQLFGYAHNQWQTRIINNVPWPDGRFDYMVTLPDEDQNTKAFQQKLEKEFGLTARLETRTVPAFLLKVADANSPGLKPSKASAAGMDHKPGRFTATNQPIDQLRSTLENQLSTLVLNQTGLKGNFDIELHWRAEGSRSPEQKSNGDELKKAMREQLGLELVPSEEPIEMLIVDRLKK